MMSPAMAPSMEVTSMFSGRPVAIPNCITTRASSEFQTRFGGEPEDTLADRRALVPVPRIPLAPADVIAPVEDLRQRHAPEPGDGEQGGGLHLHRQAAFLLAPPDLFRGLPVERVRRPGLARQVGDRSLLEDRLDRGHALGAGLDLTPGGEVMVGGPL